MADAEKFKDGMGKDGRESKEATRLRARKACKLCNSRRVRCNVMEQQPCTNCELAMVPCELIVSRRGKYIRRPGIHANGSATKRRNSMGSSADRLVQARPSASPASQQQFSVSARRASESMTAMNAATIRSSNSFTTNTTTPDSDNTVFLGESNLLTCVASTTDTRSPSAAVQTPGTAEKSALCYPISQEISARASRIAAGTTSKAASIEFVTGQGVFTFPSSDVCDAILQSYFAWFHPCFPIIDRAETSAQYANSTLSPLLFQAMLFAGSTYCPSHTIQEIGFKDRHAAKSHFYQKAKLLYDAEWEDNKMVVVQALFLMSFWRAGPLNEKDTRHWLGAAISLAQTRGFHRYTRSNGMDPKHARLRRRIWWSLYMRDRQCNASLGLPSHIRDEDCDVPMLEHADFANEGPCHLPEIFGSTTAEHEAYTIHMAGLTILLGKIVNTEFAPRPTIDVQRINLKDQLLNWKAGLPREMQSSRSEEPANLWSNMLLLAYNHIHILLYRSSFTESAQNSALSSKIDQHPSLHAATTISRIIEDMLSQNTLQYSQIHLITSLFSALCIHVTFLRSSPSGSNKRKLAEQRAQVCILGLKELQRSWDVNNWVLQLFFSFLDESTKYKLHASEFAEPFRPDYVTEQNTSTNASTNNTNNPNSSMVTPAPSESQIGETPNPSFGGMDDPDFAMKMSGAMGEAYHSGLDGLSRTGSSTAPFYGIVPEAFNLDFYDEDFSQYFGGNNDGSANGGSVREEGFDTKGLDFLSRCL